MNQEKVWDNLYKDNLIWKKETLSLPNLFKNKRVLELGCGSGKTLRSILKQKPKEVIAIDYSEIAISKCKKIFKDKINFIKADAKKLPFEDESFDYVVCYYVLNNSIKKDRELIVKGIFRVLNKSGKLLFEDFSVGDFRNCGTRFKEANTIIKKNNLICHFFNEKETKVLFKRFSNLKVKIFSSKPITHKLELNREIIRAIITK